MRCSRATVELVRLGRVSYAEALAVQQTFVRRHLDRSHASPNALLVCEHPPVYTVGIRQAPYPPEEERRLGLLGAEFFRTNRGGLITFHGPGQLVCYPVLDLASAGFRKSVRWYVCELERTVVGLCRRLGVEAASSPDTGVWVGDNKICAIGIHVSRYITSHGLALNCNTDLSWFQHITPCGLVGKGVTSLSGELGRQVSVDEALPSLLEAFGEHFGCDFQSRAEPRTKSLLL